MNSNFDHTNYLDLLAKRLVADFHPRRALDMGCGQGQLISMLQKRGVKTYGLDISRDSLCNAKHIVQDALICQANAETMPFKGNTFDLIIAHHVMEHLKSLDAIRECKRSLRPGGILCIVVPVPPLGLTKLWHALKLQRDPTHISMHSRTFWVKMFRKEGFSLIGDFQDIVMKDPPSSFWLGRWLVNRGSTGRWLWLRLAPHIRKSFLFKLKDSRRESR